MEIKQIPIDKINPPKDDLRTIIVKENLEELEDSIRQYGILSPIKVRPDGDRYEIVYGHRRFIAAQNVGLETIPCIVADIDDRETLIEKLHENLKREELNIVDQADIIHRLREREGYTYPQIAEIFGKSETWVRDVEVLHYIDPEIREAVRAGHIKRSHARVLFKHKDRERRLYFLKLCIENGASPKTLDLWIRDDLGTLESAKIAQPIQKISDVRPEVHKVMMRCAICDESVPADALYVIHVCEKCYKVLMEQKQAR